MDDYFKKIKPYYGKAIDLLWIEYQLADEERRKEIEELIMALAVKTLGITVGEERILLKPPPKEIISRGEFYVGQVIYPAIESYPFNIERDEFLRHLFILGPTGTGKSTLIMGLLIQFLKQDVPFMVFDFKRNYRCLLHSEFGQKVIVFTIGRDVSPLRVNVLQPPSGVSHEEWFEALADIISSSYLLMQGARNVLKEALQNAYAEKRETAVLKDAYVKLRTELAKCRVTTRRYGWLESSCRSLEELSKGKLGSSLNALHGWSLKELLNWPVVFELEGLGNDQKRFLCMFFLQAVFLYRKKGSLKREILRHMLIFDESYNIFPREKQGELELPSRLAREIREYGEGIIAASQQSDVSESLIANSGFKFVLRCDYPNDVLFASRLMQMDAKWFPKIQMGFCVARMPERHLSPFLFKYKRQQLKDENVLDDEVKDRYERHPGVMKLEHADIEEGDEINDDEFRLLKDIAENPISYVTERYARLGWNVRTGNKRKDKVIEKGLAFFDVLNGQVKILSLTEMGKVFLMNRGIEISLKRHGGIEHEYWKFMLRKELEKCGWKVKAEYVIGNGKSIDLVATKAKRRLLIEIETGKSDVEANIQKCLLQPGEVVVVFTTSGAREKFSALMEKYADDGVRFVPVQDFMAQIPLI